MRQVKLTIMSALGILLLGMFSSAIGVEKEITVSGTVSDTAGNPIDSAIILITRDTVSVNPTFDTIYSGPDGNFSKEKHDSLRDRSETGQLYRT